jgi:putative phosphonate metabolism protein
MDTINRYALYFAPRQGPLADFGSRWLGWNAETATAVTHPSVSGLPYPVDQITATPRKYGFHGTLKPPFRLAPGKTPQSLHGACEALAQSLPPVMMPGLALHRIGGFLALIPEGDTTALGTLAASVVRTLDPYRAPTTTAEIARRNPEKLTPRQRDLLDRWGYPYVMEEFRFHLTLSGDLPPTDADEIATVLGPALAPLLPRPFVVEDLCLFGEGADGRFRILHRYALSG